MEDTEKLEMLDFEKDSRRRDEERKQEYRRFAADLARNHEEFYPNIKYNIHWFYSRPLQKKVESV